MKKVLVLIAALCLAASPKMVTATIKIGLIAPLTGSWACEGQDMNNIVNLLAANVNENGGIDGQKIEIITADDAGDPNIAALAATHLSNQGIVAVIGTYGSSITEASQAIFAKNNIPQIANGSTAIRLTEKGFKYFLRTSPRDDEQGKVAVKALKKMGLTKIAILHDTSTFAKELADETRKGLKATQIDVVFYGTLTPDTKDYKTILTHMRAQKAQGVFFTGYYPEAGRLLRQKMEMGWQVPFLGGDATNNPELVKIAGPQAAAGFYFLSPPVPQDLTSTAAKTFMAAYQKKYQATPGSVWAVLAGDGFNALIAAIKGSGQTTPDAIVGYLKNQLKDMPGLTGRISFNAQGDRVGDLYRIYRVNEEGCFKVLP